MQSFIFLTKTFLNQQILTEFVANYFFEKSSKFLKIEAAFDTEFDTPNRNEKFQRYVASSLVLEASFDEKKDFTAGILDFYKDYSSPTLLFLGDLSQYSLSLQEGMLRILEEPPKNLFIVLFAKDRSEVLATISSRCNFVKVSQKFIIKNLNLNLLEKVKQKLPNVLETAKKMVKKEAIIFPDLKNLERDEIEFWLWQLEIYLQEFYKANPNPILEKSLDSVLQAKKLNSENLQKKFSLGILNL